MVSYDELKLSTTGSILGTVVYDGLGIRNVSESSEKNSVIMKASCNTGKPPQWFFLLQAHAAPKLLLVPLSIFLQYSWLFRSSMHSKIQFNATRRLFFTWNLNARNTLKEYDGKPLSFFSMDIHTVSPNRKINFLMKISTPESMFLQSKSLTFKLLKCQNVNHFDYFFYISSEIYWCFS